MPGARRGGRVEATIGRHFPTDFDAIGQLLAEVQEAGGTIPAHFFPPPEDSDPQAIALARSSRLQLGQRIQFAVSIWQHSGAIDSPATQRARQAKAEAIKTLSEDLQALLAGDDAILLRELDTPDEEGGSTLKGLNSALEGLRRRAAEAAQRAENASHGAPVLNGGLDKTPAFVARLARIYAESFGEPVAFTINSAREPEGPFIAFVLGVRRRLGSEVGPASVTKALRDAGWSRGQTPKNAKS